ncbi:phosphoglycerate mutase-like protein [Laetiporus sulphureus 93-53]|uniref:Phosphoglycerate mutase-like protein n=1 Tax=Laetiporus sulphureus 93-53 TaxID=1314785 RepID=A0A165EF98_9APHY|nr:phosphoglycerate mutase-like protein [Laetiporus sulphureus 93-53]KZT06930.1 phosphoglycerate mutase-like protein [Laetiporus sulphureus 93-53]
MIETIYIARHGFRLNWVTNDWASATGLPRDPPLAAYGLTQAHELADFFLSLPPEERATAIFSSPYYRCLQTCRPTSVALDVPIYVEHGLSEWYSPVTPGTGLHPRPANAATLRGHFPKIDDSWSSVWYPSRKGEDVEQCHDRCNGLLQALIPEIQRKFGGKHKRILLISHAATIIALARELLGDRSMPLRVGCCSLTEVCSTQNEPPVGHWRPKRLADGSHLKEGASRDWGFEDIVIAGGKVITDPGQPGSEHEFDEPVGLCLPDATSRM